jgi:uncharacterized membrane protein YhaH (DUF805 family)
MAQSVTCGQAAKRRFCCWTALVTKTGAEALLRVQSRAPAAFKWRKEKLNPPKRKSVCSVKFTSPPIALWRQRIKLGRRGCKMSDTLYLRRLLIGGGLLLALCVATPFAVSGMAWLACHSNNSGGCGDAGLLVIFFMSILALVGILLFIAWTVFKRLRSLKLSVWYALLAVLLIAGNIQALVFAPEAYAAGRLSWDIVTPPLLTLILVIALYWVPEDPRRGSVAIPIRIAFFVVSVLLLARLATAILYPLWLLPGGLELSYAIQNLAFWGVLSFIPDFVVALIFAALFFLIVSQWRRSHHLGQA